MKILEGIALLLIWAMITSHAIKIISIDENNKQLEIRIHNLEVANDA